MDMSANSLRGAGFGGCEPGSAAPVKGLVSAGWTRTAWRRLRDRYVAWQMARDDLEAESAKLKAEATERMRKLVDPRQVRIGDWRCSLTKAGVIQWRDLSKSEEE